MASITDTHSSPHVYVAGFWRRFCASMIDSLCLLPFWSILVFISFRVTGIQTKELSGLRIETFLELFLEGGAILFGLLVLGFFFLFLYSVIFWGITGATIGMRVMGLRVINIYGYTPEWWRVVVRSITMLLGGLMMGLGIIWIAFDREKRGLHDWVSGTYVIR